MSSLNVAPHCIALALGVGTCLVPRVGHAEVADAIYSDVRTVIEELISKELSEQVAPGIACLSGRTVVPADGYSVTYRYRPEGATADTVKTVHLEAATHFPKTLQRVFNRQYGPLRTAIRDESAGLAGLLVYQALRQLQLPAPDAAALAKLRKVSLSCPADPEKIDEKEQAARASAPCSEEPPAPAAAAGPAPKPGPDFSAIGATELVACKAEVKKGFADGTWGERTEYPLDAACKAESFECDVGLAVRAALSGQSATAQDNLIKATALVVRQLAEKVYADLHLQASPALFAAVQQQVLFLLRQQLTGDGWETKPLRASLSGVFKAVAKLDLSRLTDPELASLLEQLARHAAGSLTPNEQQLLQAAVDKLAVGGGTVALDPLAALTALFQKLEQVHAAWRSAVDAATGKLDVGSFMSGLIARGGPLGNFCPVEKRANGSLGLISADTSACQVIAKLSGSIAMAPDLVKAIADIQPILAHAGKAEYTEAAQLAIGYVFQLASRNKSDSEIAVYERFAKSVATYVLDAGQHEAPSEAARVAFRSAAVDIIQHLGQGGGLQRHLGDNAYNWLLPDLALRASWSPSYLNRTDSPTRIQASANWLNLRFEGRRTAATYVGFQASLVDPLAPLSELVLRKTDNIHYHDVNTLWANILSPRVEVLAASPALSEHLALSAGMSLRLAAPVLDKAKTTQFGDGEHYKYTLLWNAADPDEQSLWLRFLEFGFAVKYVL